MSPKKAIGKALADLCFGLLHGSAVSAGKRFQLRTLSMLIMQAHYSFTPQGVDCAHLYGM